MSRPLFRLDPLPEDEVVVLAGPEGRHAATVRRLRAGEQLRLTDGRGRYRDGEVIRTGRAELQVRAGPQRSQPAPDPRVVVFQALAKGDRGERAVELLTELGVDEVVPWAAARSVVQWRDERVAKSIERWRRTAAEASKQSRRVWWPAVAVPATTDAVAERLRVAAAAFVLHEDAERPLCAAALPAAGEIVLVVGPEGGVAPEELAGFAAAGAVAVRLGTPVLRTSTAGAAAVAALSVRLGRWN